ncbi:MAG TPA: Grx4 family monothiol glutaredoxin [Candidatus Methylopumilus sp.]|jgi:monothiol glutaredoxin
MSAQEKIQKTINEHDVVLFMKGSPKFPQCGFSSLATKILDACGTDFHAIDVLQDPEIREGIKVFANWPTIPQLYIRGEFIGGADIMKEMYETGELVKLLKANS